MPEPEKRFTVYINCEGPEFQGPLFANAVMDILRMITGNVATNRASGTIMSKDGQTTIGNWKTQWRNDKVEDRPIPRDRKPSTRKR